MISQDMAPLNGTFVLSKVHSFVGFTISHMLSEANGLMTIDTGFVKLNGDLKNSDLELSFIVKGINTNNDNRNEHLQTPAYFNADSFPTIKFKATDIELAVNNPKYKYIAKGNLTIKDVTKAVDIPFNYVGADSLQMKGMTMKTYTFAGEFSLNRTDYHVGTANAMIGSDVKINFSVETSKM
ncbi:MAG: YceI family protein [Bacteroidia bacterium]